jgi:class 3 adenylate cyclase
VRCGTCGAPMAPDARSCARCGTSFDAAAPRPGPTAIGEAGDRRIVTALFADLVDYVRMVAEHDPEEVRERVRTALAAMADAIAAYDGTREKFIGDAVFAVFGWPRAHDDDAVRATLAALAIRDVLQGMESDGEPLEVRIGIATGEVVTTARDGTGGDDLALTGSAITTAARIQSIARRGEILLDTATLEAARGRLRVTDRGSVVLRGQSEPVGIHLLDAGPSFGGPGTFRMPVTGPLVGRDPEVGRIRALLERCATTGHGGAILVVGEAGIGKTRLLAEIEDEARARGLAWTWAENTSYGQAEPYRFARVFAQAVADEHAVDSGTFARTMLFTPDLEPDVGSRFGGAIAAIARDAAFSGWEAEAPDMPADQAAVTATLLEVAGRYIDRIIETAGPRVIVIDDLHWMDPSSAGMVEVLVERAARSPIVVLAGMRPGQPPAWASWEGVERLDLGGLAMPETAQLATQVARAALDADDARRIHDRTAGNPLFVTETVRALLQDGTLAWDGGRVTLTDVPLIGLPVTLRAVLGARIDALPDDARDVLNVASVIGTSFTTEWLADLRGGARSDEALDRLLETGLIVPADDAAWRFAHPLIHDAAYAGLLTSRRRVLHARLADRLEAAGDPMLVSLIAVHRAASGDAARAIPLLEAAATAALGVGAATEAAAFWRTAAGLSSDAVAADYRSRAEAALEAARGA